MRFAIHLGRVTATAYQRYKEMGLEAFSTLAEIKNDWLRNGLWNLTVRDRIPGWFYSYVQSPPPPPPQPPTQPAEKNMPKGAGYKPPPASVYTQGVPGYKPPPPPPTMPTAKMACATKEPPPKQPPSGWVANFKPPPPPPRGSMAKEAGVGGPGAAKAKPPPPVFSLRWLRGRGRGTG